YHSLLGLASPQHVLRSFARNGDYFSSGLPPRNASNGMARSGGGAPVTPPALEIADLIRTAGAAFVERNRQWIRWKHVKVLRAIARCRTAALGGHLDECTRCAHRTPISYNSCRDRHCPKCQTAARERWIAARRRELLP